MPDELREVVDEYWGQFPPQHPLIKDAFGILFGLLYIISFFGNGCVLFVFLTTKTLRTPVRAKTYRTILIPGGLIKGASQYLEQGK